MATVRMKARETAFAQPITNQIKKMEDAVLEITHADYDYLYPSWEMLEDCYMGGGKITNAGDDVYLIKRLNEVDEHYEMRKKRSKYYNKCKQVLSTLHGHMWRKRPARELRGKLEAIANNVDREGNDADAFFAPVTEWSMALGPRYVLVNYPATNHSRKRSRTEEKILNLRPYFEDVDSRNLLDWRFTLFNGEKILDWIVIKEEAEIKHKPFFTREAKTRYKIYGRNFIEIWQYTDTLKGTKKKIPERIGLYRNTLGKVPLVPFYYDYIRFGVAKSVLSDIASLNLEHYNKHSDKDNAEYYTSFPVSVFRGLSEENQHINLSEDEGIKFPNPQSDFKFEEFKGTSIDQLRKTESDIIMEIYDIAMKQVRNLSYQRQTAESKRMDKMDTSSALKKSAIGYSKSEQTCWRLAGEWMNMKDAELDKISVIYNTDYIVEQIRADMVKALVDLNAAEKISDKTLWEILKSEELLSPDFDPEQERIQILEEAQSMAAPNLSVIRGRKPAQAEIRTEIGDEEETEAEAD